MRHYHDPLLKTAGRCNSPASLLLSRLIRSLEACNCRFHLRHKNYQMNNESFFIGKIEVNVFSALIVLINHEHVAADHYYVAATCIYKMSARPFSSFGNN